MKYTIGTTVFGDWKIMKELGEGSYGKVYEIQKTDYGITASSALKVIRIPRSPSDIRAALNEGMDERSVTTYFQGFVDEIVQEIAVMASLKSHPNVVGYEDHCVLNHAGEIGWDILIRMELLIPLQEYIADRSLNEFQVIQMSKDICRALSFCQRKGMIHRDIKPENIFVNEAGQFKLGDFGVARTIEKTTGGLSKKGTESYMAPEVYLGQPYGANIDIYSLGLVLYKFMNGNRLPLFPPVPNPITFADRENALSRRMKGEILPPPANASKDFADIILKACSYQPAERYRTAAEMLEDIEELKIKSAVPVQNPGTHEENKTGTNFFFPPDNEENSGTIGLWDIPSMSVEENILPEDASTLSKDNDTLSENKNKESDDFPRESSVLPENSDMTTLEPESITVPTDEKISILQTQKTLSSKKRLIPVVAIIAVIAAWGGKYMMQIQHEQQVQESIAESIEARESLFKAAKFKSEATALEQYKTAIEIYPDDERSYIGLGKLQIESQKYEDAYSTLVKGLEMCPDSEEIKQLSEQAKLKLDYTVKIDEADSLIKAADFEQAIQKCQEAIQLDSTQEDAYKKLVQCYLLQNNVEKAQEFLQSNATESLSENAKNDLVYACHMRKLSDLLSQGEYMNVIQYCNDNDIKDSSSGQNTSIFYQNGEIGPLANFDKSLPVLRISTIIYADNITISQGIYGSDSPNIFSGKKINIFFNTGNYYYIDGIWKNGMVSGTAIKREAVTTTSGDSWIFTYTGNIENNMFHGDITFSWQKPDGSESDSDIIHAEHGTLDCLWEENGKYVYAQGSSGVYWFKDSLKGLEGYSYELY